MEYILKLVILLSIISCSDKSINKDLEDGRNTLLEDKDIKTYFKSQIDKTSVMYPDKVFYSQQELKKSNISDFKKEIWNLWKVSNQERIREAKLKSEIDSKGDLLVWELLNDERMKIKVFTKGEKPNKNYPFFINLHGGGAYPNVGSPWVSEINEGQWYGAMEMSKEYLDGPSFYCVPRMSDDRIGQWHYKPQILAFKKIIQIGIINEIIDPNKIYVVGGSQGGYGVIKLSKFMPDYFAGVSAFAAADEPSMLENLQNLAFQMRVGEKDYEYGRVQNAYEWKDELFSLKQKNENLYKHQVTIEKGKEHSQIDYSVMTSWLKGIKRNISLNKVSYTYHNIVDNNAKYGLYSDGVYFLDFRLLKRTSDSDKFFVEVKKNKTRINVKTNKLIGSVSGELGIYIDGYIDDKIEVFLNDKKVDFKILKNSKGIMIESLALWGDPNRIFTNKIILKIK